MTLIDMNAEIGRVDGGAGLTLSSPNIRVTAEEAEGVSIRGSARFCRSNEKSCRSPASRREGDKRSISKN